MDSVISFQNVSVGYGSRSVLEGVDLKLSSGITTLIGPNGAGKTTFFRTLMGLLRPMEGKVRVCGKDPIEPQARSHIGYLPHRPVVYPGLSIRQNLEFWLKLRGIPFEQYSSLVGRAISVMGISNITDKPGRQLSRGQAQLAALARTLLFNPDIIVFDEPTSGLDPLAREHILRVTRSLRDEGKLIIYATHNLDEAAQFDDKYIVLVNGRTRKSGHLGELGKYAGISERWELRVEQDPENLFDQFSPSVEKISNQWILTFDARVSRDQILNTATENKLPIAEFRLIKASAIDVLKRLIRESEAFND